MLVIYLILIAYAVIGAICGGIAAFKNDIVDAVMERYSEETQTLMQVFIWFAITVFWPLVLITAYKMVQEDKAAIIDLINNKLE